MKIDSTITDFSHVVAKLNTTYKILKIFNPWLREPTLANKDKNTYILKLPKKGYFNISAMDPTVLADSALWEHPEDFSPKVVVPEAEE